MFYDCWRCGFGWQSKELAMPCPACSMMETNEQVEVVKRMYKQIRRLTTKVRSLEDSLDSENQTDLE